MANYKKFSFLDDFEMPEVTHDAIKQQLVMLGKTHAIKKRKSLDSMPLEERLNYIKNEVYKILGRYKNYVKVIRNENEFNNYINRAIELDCLTLDTETNNSLDPLTCKLMGLCLYLPNSKPVYVPVNHVNHETNELLENQVSLECITKAFKKLKDSNTKIIYHNGKFDIRVCYNVTGVYLPIWWDTMIAAQLLNENELARLKYQYKIHVDPTIGTYNIEKLFTGLPYELVDPEIFALYAAIDAFDTYLLQQKQQNIFEHEDMKNLYRLFNEIEIPTVLVVSKMEDDGICLDLDFLNKLNNKYSIKKKEYADKLKNLLEPYKNQIKYYQNLGKLDDPVNFESPPQLNIVLYDIMKTPIPETGKSTDKATLKSLKTPFTETILEYRHYSKLISGFTEPLPTWLSKKDGKLHASFNQMGKEENNVRTGRFSSTDPNLQQIPSREKAMRMVFKASPGYVIVGADYSQQEPRLLASLCKEQNLIKTYNEGKDLYATIGSFIFHKDYWECMEHWEDGSANPEGGKIRKKCKQIVLGITYGMGAKLMASNLGISIEECKDILNEFFKMFPTIKQFMVDNEQSVKEKGFVEDYIGRRRHLPDADLEPLKIEAKKNYITDSDVFIDCVTEDSNIELLDDNLTKIWEQKWKEYQEAPHKGFNSYDIKKQFKELAKNNGVDTFDNGAFISKALTQCTNARIQGCLGGETKILTKEFGIKNISDLVNKNIHVWDGDDWTSAKAVYSGRKQKCIVTFTNGQEIICSPNHLFKTRGTRNDYYFKKCSDLKNGYRICISNTFEDSLSKYSSFRDASKKYAHNAHVWFCDDIKDSFIRGQILGRLASDGSYSLRQFGASGAAWFVAEHEYNILDFLLKNIPYKYKIDKYKRPDRNQEMCKILLGSHTLVSELCDLDIKHRVDSRILEDTSMLRGFISGFYDGDGSASSGHITLTFGTQYDFDPMIRDLQKALLIFGIRSRYRKYSGCYRLTIYKQDSKKFASRIGFINNKKQELAENIDTIKDNHVFGNCLIVDNVNITDEYVDMYDICNTERGYFVADGLIVHNSAATLTKKAMVEIFNDKEMKDLGYRILVPVHDELLGECPIENVKEVEKRLSYLMINAAKPECSVSMKVDTYTVSHWYADEVYNSIYDEYNNYIKENESDAFQKILDKYPELSENVLKRMCNGTYDTLSEEL